jgi:indole-3-acetate monooxygenase
MLDTLARVRELSAAVAKRADEIEQSRALPADLREALAGTGCLRMVAPREHGGQELPMSGVLPVLTELARAEASTGWLVGQVALAQLIVGCCPARAVADAYADGPDLLVAGAVAPKGRASSTEDGWRITGQWPFVTGCAEATWFYLNCVVLDGRAVALTPDGLPQTRITLVPAAEVSIVDTWQVLGLRGTGSNDVRASGVLAPAYRGFTLATGDPAAARAQARIARSSLIIAAVSTGIAAGAVQDIVDLAAGGKRPALSPKRLAGSEVFQDRLGEAHMTLRAASALLAEQAAASDSFDAPSSARERAELRATAAQVSAMAARVVETAYTLGGGSAVYDSSPLQRRLRDMRAATQHFVAGRAALTALGAVLVGQSPEAGGF